MMSERQKLKMMLERERGNCSVCKKKFEQRTNDFGFTISTMIDGDYYYFELDKQCQMPVYCFKFFVVKNILNNSDDESPLEKESNICAWCLEKNLIKRFDDGLFESKKEIKEFVLLSLKEEQKLYEYR